MSVNFDDFGEGSVSKYLVRMLFGVRYDLGFMRCDALCGGMLR